VHDRRGALGERGLEVVEKRFPGFGVEPGRGLVEQQQLRFERERTREADALGLAAG
jgi:hypothetical protein